MLPAVRAPLPCPALPAPVGQAQEPLPAPAATAHPPTHARPLSHQQVTATQVARAGVGVAVANALSPAHYSCRHTWSPRQHIPLLSVWGVRGFASLLLFWFCLVTVTWIITGCSKKALWQVAWRLPPTGCCLPVPPLLLPVLLCGIVLILFGTVQLAPNVQHLALFFVRWSLCLETVAPLDWVAWYYYSMIFYFKSNILQPCVGWIWHLLLACLDPVFLCVVLW